MRVRRQAQTCPRGGDELGGGTITIVLGSVQRQDAVRLDNDRTRKGLRVFDSNEFDLLVSIGRTSTGMFYSGQSLGAGIDCPFFPSRR